MSRELGRFQFGDGEEVGIYEVEQSDVDWDCQHRGRVLDAVGDLRLVWFDQQDPGWPVHLPREMVERLAQEFHRIAFGEASPRGRA